MFNQDGFFQMETNSIELSRSNEKLKLEITSLHRQLKEARDAISQINSGNIDAVVVNTKNDLKVYSERTADRTYRILIEKMHEGAVTLNKDGVILYCNSFFANMVKMPLQKVIGSRLGSFIPDSSVGHFLSLFNHGWKEAIKEELSIKDREGILVPTLMSINMLTIDDEVVLSIILTDLTIPNENREKLKQSTEQIEQKTIEIASTNKELAFQIDEKDKRTAELNLANTDVKELGELNTHKESVLAMLSHDLRNPLAGIIGVTEFLKDEFETMENSKVQKMLDLLYKASRDELDMLDSLVEWARIKYASEAFTPVKINLSQYVTKVVDTLRENAVAKSLDLNADIKESITAFADEKMLISILQNLISNSIKHTPTEGTITITATEKADTIVVEVRDTGIGMSQEVIDKLFTPQLKSLSNAREENKGAGIGLLLVKGFVTKNGGDIWVESQEGKGSSFFFTLPVGKLSE